MSHTNGQVSSTEALAWLDEQADALGREAVRRLLAGEQHTPPHPDVPDPEELLARAHASGAQRDAIALTVAALRITSGIAWRWIGARYLLVDCDVTPDLEDRGAGGMKVTGKPYADAARDAASRLVRSPSAAGNDLAPGNERGLTFAQLARRWRVTDDLVGATVGPGAPRWIDAAKTSFAGTDLAGRSYYRVVALHAAWTRNEG